jgi:hypothetical protein
MSSGQRVSRRILGVPGPAVPKLPEANEFSPGIVDLRRVLSIAEADPGDRAAQVEAIRVEYFQTTGARLSDPARRLRQQRTRSNNVLIGLKGYQLYSLSENSLTELGKRLHAESSTDARYAAFAQHILTNCHGLEVLRAVRALQAREIRVTKNSLDTELRAEGFVTLPRATTHHLILLKWLAVAGVIDDTGSYRIDEARVADLVGTSLDTFDEWQWLTPAQKAFLRTLRRMAESTGDHAIPGHELIDAVAFEHGQIFRPDTIRREILRPLEQAGWLTIGGVGPGRGGKSGLLTPTTKLIATDFELLSGLVAGELPADLRALLNTPLRDIARDLRVADSHKRGLALELLALRLARDAGLVPVRLRLRGARTGGGEVDLVAEGAQAHFTRWLFQCKNQKSRVALSDLAKEVGMATLLQAQVIVIATTSMFAGSVAAYANELMRTSALQVILIDGRGLEMYVKSGSTWLLDFLRDQAQISMRKKRTQVIELLEYLAPEDS